MKKLFTLLLISLLSQALAQSEGLRNPGGPSDETEPVPEGPDDNGRLFRSLIALKSEKQRRAYQMQMEHYIKNKTASNFIVKLWDTEESDAEDDENIDGSFLDPFFRWLQPEKKSKFEKLKRLKKRGLRKMSEKLEGWNLTGGLFQSFYGPETGLSVLNVVDSHVDMILTWVTILADPDVEFVDVDMEVNLLETECNLRSDWGYKHTRARRAADKLGISEESLQSEAEVLIAVIDTGVNYDHPALEGRIWVNLDELNGEEGVDDDGNGFVDDIWGWNFASDSNDVRDGDGHGTHVAGIIAANPTRRPSFEGVAPNAMILPCRFTESPESGYISAAIQCMEYAFDMGADIASNSWGGAGAYSLALEEAMIRASRNGMLQINAAGNSGVDNDVSPEDATFPAAFDTDIIISVAAIDRDGKLTEHSNYGNSTTDIGAPGISIVSTDEEGGFTAMSGTSQATPYITGAAALLLGACRERQLECTATDIKRALMSGAEHSEFLEGLLASGGFLDIPQAARSLGLFDVQDENRDTPDVCTSAAATCPIPAAMILIALMMSIMTAVIVS